MKRTFLLACMAMLLHYDLQAHCKTVPAAAPVSITITNASSLAREGEIVEIPYEQLAARLGTDKTFRLVNKQTGREVPYQLAFAGKEQPQQLLVQVSVPARSTITVTVIPGKPAAVQPRTFGRFVPERKDDFAWENDRIAFRMYGPALENFPKEMAHGIDVWTKRTTDLVVNNWYKIDNYHHDNGQGLDYYSVGMTLGAGDIAPVLHDSICYPRNYRTWKVLDNGPLRTTFQLGYEAWQVGNRKVSVVKTISLDAGSQLNKMSVQYVFEGDSLPVVVGIVKREQPGSMLLDEKTGVMGYWEPQHGADGTTALGCILPAGAGPMQVTKVHLQTAAKVAAQQAFVYYFGAAWDKAGRFTTSQQWFDYLQAFAGKLKEPLQVKVLN